MAKRVSLAKRRVIRKKVRRVEKTAKLGTGARFQALEKVACASGARNPQAVAAAIGKKKYGKAKMARLSRRGRKK